MGREGERWKKEDKGGVREMGERGRQMGKREEEKGEVESEC